MFKFTKEEKKLFLRDSYFSKLLLSESTFEVCSIDNGYCWRIVRYDSKWPLFIVYHKPSKEAMDYNWAVYSKTAVESMDFIKEKDGLKMHMPH